MKIASPQHTMREYLALYRDEHKHLGTRLTHMIGIPMIVASVPTAFANVPVAVGLFVGGWALQYVGHYVFEGNKPAFYADPYYLLVGPVWVATEWMQLFGVPVPEALTPAVGSPADRTVNGEGVGAVA